MPHAWIQECMQCILINITYWCFIKTMSKMYVTLTWAPLFVQISSPLNGTHFQDASINSKRLTRSIIHVPSFGCPPSAQQDILLIMSFLQWECINLQLPIHFLTLHCITFAELKLSNSQPLLSYTILCFRRDNPLL